MGLMQKLSRKLSGTRAESGVRSSNSTTAGSRDGLQQLNSRDPVRSTRDKYPSAENGRPHYASHPSTASSNISVPSQLCDVVVHCATVLPRTNTNTSSIHSNDVQQNGFDGNDNNFSSQRNGNRDTIMPLHTDNNNDSYRAGYEAGRLYKPQSVPSSLHSSRPGTGGHRGEPYHTPPSALNGSRSNSSMNIGHSHASAFNHQPNSWNHSGPSTDSSQVSQNRNTFRMESGAYDAGYRDALAQIQRSLG